LIFIDLIDIKYRSTFIDIRVSKTTLSRIVCEGGVIAGYIVKEVDLILLEHESGRYRVEGCGALPLVEKTALVVQVSEEVHIGLGAEPVQVTDFEVGPLRMRCQ
jgi:hypothetical protein